VVGRDEPLRMFQSAKVGEGIRRTLDHPMYAEAVLARIEVTTWWTSLYFDSAPDVAIWNRTGNCYHLDTFGAAEDDPFIEITPLHVELNLSSSVGPSST
jgi:hypothetical protein